MSHLHIKGILAVKLFTLDLQMWIKKVTTFRSPYFIAINDPCCRAILSPFATRVVRKDIGMPFLCTREVPVN